MKGSSSEQHLKPLPTPPLSRDQARQHLENAVTAVTRVLRGNERVVRMLFAAVIGRGHVLIEDVPGVGKTTLARSAARVMGCSFSRVQFTADMLPADVLGVHVLDPQSGGFVFKRGPIFAHVVLADEINRASPKTQSAMLEAMSDRQVTVDETTTPLPELFTVLATQNPVEHHGAYPLPESQLDRFMVRLAVGYPPADDERELVLSPRKPARDLAEMPALLRVADIEAMQGLADKVTMTDSVADYLLALVRATRDHPDVLLGCSPRGSLLFASMARAWAFVENRNYVLPDDVKQLAESVLLHRIVVAGKASGGGSRQEAKMVIGEIVSQTPVPR